MRRRGDLAEALSAAAAQGPGQVAVLAERAQVGYAYARYTASRMVARGELVRVDEGRPAVLGLPEPDDCVCMLPLSFWDQPAGAGSASGDGAA